MGICQCLKEMHFIVFVVFRLLHHFLCVRLQLSNLKWSARGEMLSILWHRVDECKIALEENGNTALINPSRCECLQIKELPKDIAVLNTNCLCLSVCTVLHGFTDGYWKLKLQFEIHAVRVWCASVLCLCAVCLCCVSMLCDCACCACLCCTFLLCVCAVHLCCPSVLCICAVHLCWLCVCAGCASVLCVCAVRLCCASVLWLTIGVNLWTDRGCQDGGCSWSVTVILWGCLDMIMYLLYRYHHCCLSPL